MEIMTATGWRSLSGFQPSLDARHAERIEHIKAAKRHVSECHRMPKDNHDQRKARHHALNQAYDKLSKARDWWCEPYDNHVRDYRIVRHEA